MVRSALVGSFSLSLRTCGGETTDPGAVTLCILLEYRRQWTLEEHTSAQHRLATDLVQYLVRFYPPSLLQTPPPSASMIYLAAPDKIKIVPHVRVRMMVRFCVRDEHDDIYHLYDSS